MKAGIRSPVHIGKPEPSSFDGRSLRELLRMRALSTIGVILGLVPRIQGCKGDGRDEPDHDTELS
jgi:hypothetical protein